MATGGQIRYNVGFNIDKTGLNELTKTLQNVQQELNKTNNTDVDGSLKDGVRAAQQLESILNDAWNSKLNQLDLNKVNTGIKSTFGSVQQLKNEMEKGGATGSAAYNKIASSVLNTNLQLKQSNKLLDDMADTMAKTVKWGITSSIFNRITGSIQEAWGYTKRLDNSLNDIRIVTEKSAEAMQQFAREANNAAKSLGASTTDYTEASLIYFQQGLSDEEVAARAQTTIKAANVTGQSADEVSEQLTAVWNGYKASAQEAELYVDKLAAVAASTAADLEELSTGMSKVASAANSMGVDIDQLNAQLATIVSVTRQAPESVGTALKTIYARLGDLAVDGEDEFGVALGTVSKTMEEMGIQILDEQGQMREMGEVIEETATKWNTWTEAQRQAAAVAIAGKRQYNNLVALFENWDMYTDALNTSVDATGTLQKQQDIYMESMKAHLQELSTEAEKTYDILFDEELVKDFIDITTNALSIFNNYINGLGGGVNTLIALGGIVTNIFSKQIGTALVTQLSNLQKFKENADAIDLKENFIKQGISDTHIAKGENIGQEGIQKEFEIASKILTVQESLTTEQYNQLTSMQHEVGLEEQKIQEIKSYSKYLENNHKSQNTSLKILEDEADLKKEELQAQKDLLEYLELCSLPEEQQLKHRERQAELSDEIFEENSHLAGILGSLGDEQLEILEATQSIETTQDDIVKLINKQKKLIQDQEKSTNEAVRAAKNKKAAEDGTLETLEKEQEARERLIKQTIQQAERQKLITKAVQGMTALVNITSSFAGIIKTLNNEDLSFEEKMIQSSTVLLTTLPMIINNLDSIKAIVPGVQTVLTQLVVTYGKSSNAIAASNALASGTTLGLRKSIMSLLPVIGSLLVTIAPYIIVAGAVAGITWACVKAYNADAEAAEKAAKASKEAANAANEAKEAYDNLASSFDAYDKAVNTLEELAKDTEKLSENTEEYKEALKSANDQAMELIKTNKNLAKYATRDEKGLITFEGADAEIAAARAKASLAGGVANLSQITANEAQLKSDYTDFQRVVRDADISNAYISEDQISTLVSHVNAKGGITSDEIRELVEGFGIEITPAQEDLISALEKTTPELLKLAEETHNLNETNKLLREDALRTSLGTNANYAALNANEQDVVASLYGEGLTDAEIENLRNKAKEKYYQDAAFGGGNEDEIHRLYADARGWTLSKNKSGDKAVYVDAEGNEQTISDDTARAYLTELQVAEKMASYNEDNLNNITEGVKKISAVGNSFGDNVSSEFMGFLNKKDTQFEEGSLSPEMLESLRNDLAKSISGVTEAEWDALGYESAQTFLDAVNKSLDSYNMAPYWEKIAASSQENLSVLSDSLNKLYSGNSLDEKTIEELEEKYSELGSIQNKNSYEYIEALEKIRELEEDNHRQALANEDEANREREKNIRKEIGELESKRKDSKNPNVIISYNEQIKKLEEELDEILTNYTDNTYEIKLAIDADLSSDVENAFGLANEFENIRSMITDDLKVSFDEAQEFISKGYGDILIDAEETSEGMIQLNADATKAFIKNKEIELKTDKDNKIKQLTQQRAMLTAQLDILQEELEAYLSVSKTTDASEKEKAMNKALLKEAEYQGQVELLNEELKNDNEQKIELSESENEFYSTLSTLYQQDAENSMLADEDADEATKTYHKNVINYYQKMHQAAKQYADAVKAAAAGQDVGEFTVQAISGENVNTTSELNAVGATFENEVKELDIKSLFDSDKWNNLTSDEKNNVSKKLAEDTQKRIDALKNQIGSIDSAIAALNTSSTTFDETINNIGKQTDKNNEKNRDTAETLEDVYDRYREINIILSTLETNLGRVQKQQEKLTGKSYTENLQQQLDLLNQQIEANREKIKIAQTEEAELMAALANQGANFNEAGQVTNYREVMDSALAKANAVINIYNSLSAEEQKTYKATMEAAIASYEALDETFQRFDELYAEEIPGLVDTIQEELDQAIELKIEQFNTKIQIDLDLKDAERQWNDFYAEIVKGLKEDDLVGQSELSVTQLGTYVSKDGNDSSLTLNKDLEKLAFLNSQANQIISGGWSDTYGDNVAALLEDLNKANDQLITDMTAVKELADGVYDNYLASIDKVIEGNDNVIEQYEFLGELLGHNQKIIELLSGDSKASELTGYYIKRNALNQQTIEEHAKNAQYYQEMMDSIDDKTSEEWQKWSEAWQNEVSSLNAAIVQGMEDAAAAYTNAIELAMQEMESAFTDGLGFEYIQDEWDLTNENAEKYLDTINSAYEISKLENKFIDAINNTSSLSAQKKLTTAMEQEIKLLEEADQISQYDIDRANLKYDLTLKQIALEEAQANKTSMRLQRDSQGNYGYVFAADEDEITKAQQELADAENELYNFDKEAYNEKIESVLKAEQDLQSKLQEIWTNENLSEEQKLQYSTMINEQYRDIIEADIEESEKTKQNLSADTLDILSKYYDEELLKARETFNNTDKANAIAIKNMQERFKNLPSSFDNILIAWGNGSSTGVSGQVQTNVDVLLENMQLSFDTGIANITSKFQKKFGGDSSLQAVIEDSLNKCKNASTNFQTTIEGVAKAAGIAFSGEDGTGGLTGKTKSLKDIMEGLLSLTNQYAITVTGEEGTLTAAQNLSEAYSIQYKQVKDLNDSILSYNTYLSNLAKEAEKATKETQNLTTALKEQYEAKKATENKSSGVSSSEAVNKAKENKSSGSGNSSSSSQPAPAPAPSKSLADAYDYINSGKAGNGKSRAENMAAAGFTPEQIAQAQSMINEAYGKGMTANQIKNKYNAYDTGGYTGDWNSSEGRLALLHEKEIVLNKTDTANILDIVSMVRDMTNSSLRGANGMMSGMMETLASITNNSTNSRQEIHITAEFPNATSVADIEEAFRSLPNIASQYAFSY